MDVHLADLNDSSEDGTVSTSDLFNSSHIKTLFTQVPPVGTYLKNIDVTDAIYNDLFGPGSNEPFSGFVLLGFGCRFYGGCPCTCQSLEFDRNLPSLTINIKDPQVPSLSLSGMMLLAFVFSLYAIRRLRHQAGT